MCVCVHALYVHAHVCIRVVCGCHVLVHAYVLYVYIYACSCVFVHVLCVCRCIVCVCSQVPGGARHQWHVFFSIILHLFFVLFCFVSFCFSNKIGLPRTWSSSIWQGKLSPGDPSWLHLPSARITQACASVPGLSPGY